MRDTFTYQTIRFLVSGFRDANPFHCSFWGIRISVVFVDNFLCRVIIPTRLVSLMIVPALGCAGNSTIFDNISLLGLRAIENEEVTSIVGDDSNLPILNYWVDGDLIVVNVKSSKNFAQFVKKYDASLIVESYFCSEPDTPVILGLPHIYSGSANVSVSAADDDLRVRPQPLESTEAVYSYQFVLFQKWGKVQKVSFSAGGTSEKKEYYALYDFGEEARDVCVNLRFSDMVSMQVSNKLVISKEHLEKALTENVSRGKKNRQSIE